MPGPAGAETHRLVWADGQFFLANHPDPEAELALVALGGDRCGCLDILDAWHQQHADPTILSVGAHHATESVLLDTRVATSRRAEVRRWQSHLAKLRSGTRRRNDRASLHRLAAAAGPAERAATQRLGLFQLLSLPPVLQMRLQTSVAAALVSDGRLDRLSVPTAKRAEPFLRQLGWIGRVNDVEVAGGAGSASVDMDRAVLPADWLPQVWGRGLGTVGDSLVVAVTRVAVDGATLDVVVVEPGKASVAARVERWENGWCQA